MPSALSVSSAYSISLRLALDIGQRQRREQAEAGGVIAHDLDGVLVEGARQARYPAPSPNHTPGVVMEMIAVATLFLSMSSIARCGDHPYREACATPRQAVQTAGGKQAMHPAAQSGKRPSSASGEG